MAKKKQDKKEENRRAKKTSLKKEMFLAAFSQFANVTQACETAGVCSSYMYSLKESDPEFAERWEQARKEAIDRMVQETSRRAFLGVRRLKFTGRGQLITIPDPSGRTEKKKVRVKKGKKWVEEEQEVPVMVPYVEHEYSDVLAMFLLKAHDPERFRENVAIQGLLKNLNANLNLGGDGTQLKTTEELLAENQIIVAEINRLLGHTPIEANGHSGNGETT